MADQLAATLNRLQAPTIGHGLDWLDGISRGCGGRERGGQFRQEFLQISHPFTLPHLEGRIVLKHENWPMSVFGAKLRFSLATHPPRIMGGRAVTLFPKMASRKGSLGRTWGNGHTVIDSPALAASNIQRGLPALGRARKKVSSKKKKLFPRTRWIMDESLLTPREYRLKATLHKLSSSGGLPPSLLLADCRKTPTRIWNEKAFFLRVAQ